MSLLIICFVQIPFSRPGTDPFAFFRPSLTITASEQARLDQGYAFARVLQTKGPEVGVFAAIPVRIDGDRLVAWQRQVEEMKKSSYVIAIGRFSNPPRIEDLAKLELDGSDVNAIRSCRPNNCEIKLSADEMKQLQHTEAHAKGDARAAVQQAFRQIVLNRVEQYLASGYTPIDEDHQEQVKPSSRFAMLLDHTPFLKDRLPELAKGLRDHPSNAEPGVESLLYWSKEHLGRKAVISVTHVRIVRNHDSALPDALIVDRDVFSTHYVNASLSMLALMPGNANGTNYLVYLNRTEVDVLHGMFGGIIRRSIQSHLRNAANVLTDLRRRLESGDPPEFERLDGEGTTR